MTALTYGELVMSAALVNNFVLTKFLGLCPIFGASQQLRTAIGMSGATLFVLTLTSGMTTLIEHTIIMPLQLGSLRIIVYILTIAVTVQCVELMIRATHPLLHQLLGIYLPLITTNCAVLGLALLNQQTRLGFIDSLLFGFGTALGFGFVLIIFTSIRMRLSAADVPTAFRGMPIAFISAGILALAFSGFSGMLPHHAS